MGLVLGTVKQSWSIANSVQDLAYPGPRVIENEIGTSAAGIYRILLLHDLLYLHVYTSMIILLKE